jgi:hypothetical protein
MLLGHIGVACPHKLHKQLKILGEEDFPQGQTVLAFIIMTLLQKLSN